MASTNPARGMRDFLPADVRKRNYVIGIIKEVYESYGFEPLETPAVENIETLTGKYGEEGNQLIYKILKRGEKLNQSLESGVSGLEQETAPQSQKLKTQDFELSDLALRYDLTVPLARVVANNKNELPKFFKRYQIQPVWRADRPARGRFREFYQCDVDVIGSTSVLVEAEVIGAFSEILRKLGFSDFIILINHREVLSAILSNAGVPVELQAGVLIALDKIDKIGRPAFVMEIKELGLSDEQVDIFASLMQQVEESKDNDEGFNVIEEFVDGLPNGTAAVRDLRKIRDLAEDSPLVFDPTLARGLSYYTGTIMEINVPDLAGSLGGGGRYDGLIGMFGKEQIPACGFSLGLERILVVMEERGMFPPEIADSTPADVMVTIWSEETIGESLKLAQELRASGLRVTLYPEADKLGKQFKYADSIDVPWVCVLGEGEIAEANVTLKNMASGEQQTYKRNEVASKIIL